MKVRVWRAEGSSEDVRIELSFEVVWDLVGRKQGADVRGAFLVWARLLFFRLTGLLAGGIVRSVYRKAFSDRHAETVSARAVVDAQPRAAKRGRRCRSVATALVVGACDRRQCCHLGS